MKEMALQRNPEMSALEWKARCDLAASFHIADQFGWTDILDTHFSVRLSDQPDAFLMNGYLETFEEITASKLMKVDMARNVISGEGRINAAGTAIHSGVYSARPDINCVMHTHTPNGVAVSLLPDGLRPISQDALHIYDELAYHPYGVPATDEEGEALGKSCRSGSCIILQNHGLLAIGPTIPATLKRLYKMERASEIEVKARMMSIQPADISADVIGKFSALMRRVMSSDQYGVPEWEALVRKLKKQNIDYSV